MRYYKAQVPELYALQTKITSSKTKITKGNFISKLLLVRMIMYAERTLRFIK